MCNHEADYYKDLLQAVSLRGKQSTVVDNSDQDFLSNCVANDTDSENESEGSLNMEDDAVDTTSPTGISDISHLFTVTKTFFPLVNNNPVYNCY